MNPERPSELARTQPSTYYLGVNGGGTTTTASLWCDIDGTERACGRGVAGSSNLSVDDPTAALAQLTLAVGQALSQLPAGGSLAGVCLAMSGSDRPSVKQVLRDWAAAASLGGTVSIVHDAEPLLLAAERDRPAIVLIAGTGSIAFGRGPTSVDALIRHDLDESVTHRAGGWGSPLGDEGSGYWLVMEALRHWVRAHDERQPWPAYAVPLLQSLGLADAIPPLQELPRALAALTRAQIAQGAPCLIRADDDATVQLILARCVDEWARLVRCVATRLDCGDAGYDLVLAGSVLLRSPSWLRTRLHVQLQASRLSPRRVFEADDPAQWAAHWARQQHRLDLAARKDLA